MAAYDSIYEGQQIDNIITKAGMLPAVTDGINGQFLRKTINGYIWDNIPEYSLVTSSANGLMSSADKIRLDSLVLFFTNKTIATSEWVNDITYENYPYRADIACSGVTANYYPEVVFSLADAVSGYFAPVCESFNNIVRIYASNIPENTITIPTIKCTKAG